MRRSVSHTAPALAAFLVVCSDADPERGVPPSPADTDVHGSDRVEHAENGVEVLDAGGISREGGVGLDAGEGCSVKGAPGECMDVALCIALKDHTSVQGYCLGGAEIRCCMKVPDVADNPPTPDGYKLMADAQVTADMSSWAVSILHDWETYPLFATSTKAFGILEVLARVEWHPPDFQNNAVHRGVTLYKLD